MVNATNSDGNSSDTTDQGGEMVRNYKMEAYVHLPEELLSNKNDGSTTRLNRLEIKEVEYMRFKTTQAEVQQL